MHRSPARAAIVAIAGLVLSLIAVSPSHAAPAGGYNDADCVPSTDHPNPVVLLHGLGAPPGQNFSYLGPELAAAGFCAFAFDYGATAPLHYPGGFAPIDESASSIRAFIADLRAQTGSAEVDIVGHSEGGFHSLYVPKMFRLGDEVGSVVALGPPTHGTDASGLLTIPRLLPGVSKVVVGLVGCAACDELGVSEDAIDRLNDGPITVAGIDYTVIASTNDRIVTPTSTSFVDEPGVRNIRVQDVCRFDPVGHLGLAFDPTIRDMVIDALDPDVVRPVTCSYGVPF